MYVIQHLSVRENGAKEANVSLVEKILDDDTNLHVRGDYAQNPCPSSPILTQFLTYICHLTLLVVALIAEWLRYNNYILNDWAQERVEQQVVWNFYFNIFVEEMKV